VNAVEAATRLAEAAELRHDAALDEAAGAQARLRDATVELRTARAALRAAKRAQDKQEAVTNVAR
jgi:hypothetical protein